MKQQIKKKYFTGMIQVVFLSLAIAVGIGCYDDSMGDVIEQENEFSSNPFGGRPVPGNYGIITTSDITTTSIRLEWTRATDDETPQHMLEYRVYYSTDSSFSVFTYANNWTTDMPGIDVTGLTPATTYYFNVMVRDGGGATATYQVVSANTTTAASGTMYLYPAGTYTGYIVQLSTAPTVRGGLDAICKASPTYATLKCGNARAFISADATDSIADSPSKGVPIKRVIKSPTGSTIASDWASLLAVTGIADTLENLGVVTTYWWSGSTATGVYDSLNSCGGWESEDNKISGYVGDHKDKAFPNWIKSSSPSNPRNCSNSHILLCLCW